MRLPVVSTRLVNVLPLLALSLIQAGCKRNALYYLETGNKFYAQGRYADASINFRKSIQQNARLAESHYRLGLAELKQGQANVAYSEFRRAIELAPERDEIRIDLADVCLNGYQASKDKPRVLYDQAATTAKDLLAKDPKSFDGLRLRAGVLTVDGRFEDALETYKKAEAIRPMDPGVIYPMLQVQFRLNQGPQAEQLARRFLKVHPDIGSVYDLLTARYLQEGRKSDAEELLKSKAASLPKDDRPLLQLAGFYYQQQQAPEMSQTLNRILSNPKVFPQGRAIVGDFYSQINKPDVAIEQYNAGLKSSPNDKVLYQKRIVKLLTAQGKRDAALRTLDDILKANADDSDARTARAILLRESNDPAKLKLAASDLATVIEKDPHDEVAKYNLGLVYLAKRDLNAARTELLESARAREDYLPPRVALAELSQKTRNYSETIRFANEILAVDPTNADGRLWHAAGLLGNKKYKEARMELEGLLGEYPNSPNVNLHLIVLDIVEKKYKDAESRCLRFYKAGQQDMRPLEAMIQVYVAEKQTDRALALLEQELKQDPTSIPVHLLLASTATRAGKLDLALQQYQWLQSNDPNSVQIHESLGQLYQLKGDINSALASYQKARDLVPNDPKVLAVIAFLQDASGKDVDAIANLQKQLAMDPQNTIAMNNLAFLLADTSTDLDRAQTLAEAAQRKAPNNPGIADTVGWVYTKKGLNDSAIQIFDGLVKKYPDQAAFRYHLGVALLQKGQIPEAKSEFVISLSKNPPKDMAERIKQILSKLG